MAAHIRYLHGSGDPDEWSLLLFDKRSEYQRTHRLRIDPAPYRRLVEELDDPLADEFISFLEHEEYRPAVNRLEAKLLDLVNRLGIVREIQAIGRDGSACDLVGLRAKLEHDGRLSPNAGLRVVAADSVHSATRQLVAGDEDRIRHTHQTVARLMIHGADLPDRLPRLDYYKLAKLLGSVLDYRRNDNGYAEVDLFLQRKEHDAVAALNAAPAAPFTLDAEVLDRLDAPLFVSLVRQLAAGGELSARYRCPPRSP